MPKEKTKNKNIPKSLNSIGQEYYENCIQLTKEAGMFNPLDLPTIECMANLYQDIYDTSLSPKDKRDTIKLFFQLSKAFGGTPASRQTMKLKGEEAGDDEEEKLLDELRGTK